MATTTVARVEQGLAIRYLIFKGVTVYCCCCCHQHHYHQKGQNRNNKQNSNDDHHLGITASKTKLTHEINSILFSDYKFSLLK